MTGTRWRDRADAVRDRMDRALGRIGDRRDRIVDALAFRKDRTLDWIGGRRDRIADAVGARRDAALDRIDDAWYSINDRLPHTRRVLGGAAAVVAILLLAGLGPSVLRSLSGPTSDAGSARLPVAAPPAPSNLSAGELASPVPSSTSSAEATTTAAAAPVETIELVPPLRDVIVVVDGVELVSDARGAIAVPGALRGASFSFVGVREQPPLRQVVFAHWSDGNSNGDRSLADVAGPVTQIGVVEQRRVTIWTSVETPSGTEVSLDTQAGPISLPVGATTWVDAERATLAGGTLVAEVLRYTTDEILLEGTVQSIPAQAFSPSPEALWVVDVGATLNAALVPAPDPMFGQP